MAKRKPVTKNIPQTGHKVTDWRFTHYDIHQISSVKTRDCRILILVSQFH
jgi:hypothetical protein